MIESVQTGIVYRNPKPHLRARHTWHPSLVRLEAGELVASFDIGQGAESLDYRTYLSRSADEGETWSEPVRLFEDPIGRCCTHTVRISRMGDGALVGFGGRHYRDDPEEGLTNRENLGFVPMDLILLRSQDEGRNWAGPETIEPPLVGPAFEICHPIMELRDGRWLAPTATWKGWDGEAPNGMKAVALVSHDRGRTWPDHADVMDQYARGVISWEQSVVQLADGRLLAVAWAYDEARGQSEATPFALAADDLVFSAPRMTGLQGQTAKLIVLGDDRILCLYRRDDKPGLWANVSRVEKNEWINQGEAPIWQGARSGMVGEGSHSDELSALKFGYPSMALMPDGMVMAVFWCEEEGINNIRWVRLRVD
ncbi:MAG: sialidase family protein [Candidatus Latescibacteria bacterium]|jgi:sialidase-1|nr:sialidase family protein [Candidatus Latescibacterota bacterium]